MKEYRQSAEQVLEELQSGAEGARQRRWVQRAVLAVDLVAVALMGLLNLAWMRG